MVQHDEPRRDGGDGVEDGQAQQRSLNAENMKQHTTGSSHQFGAENRRSHTDELDPRRQQHVAFGHDAIRLDDNVSEQPVVGLGDQKDR